MKRGRIVVVMLFGLILAGAGAAAGARRRHIAAPSVPAAPNAPSVTDAPSPVRVPDSLRIRVQVLNATKTHGLARRATMLLRDRGLDVVEIGNLAETRDTTLVLDLSGHPEWAKRVAQIMGAARIEARTDSSRYLDIAVVLGSAWRPPVGPLRP
jgi:hypothetical protein